MQFKDATDCIQLTDLITLIKLSPEYLTIIDVRNPDEFAEKHIPAAINIPLNNLSVQLTQFTKENTLVTVCGKGGGRSEQAAKILKQSGFLKVFYLCGGTFGWYENETVVV